MAKKSKRNEMSDAVHLSATVYGRVQGVFFRYFVQNLAEELGLEGYVRNLVGGDAVEVQAEGKKMLLNKMLEQLRVGPPGARVERVDVKWVEYSGHFEGFTIKYQ
jgi:acylphosphatase